MCRETARKKRYARTQEWKAANPDRTRQHRRKARKAALARDPERVRDYSRKWHARQRYGLTLAEYKAVLARGCAICGSDKQLHLDHDHASGTVRDALCRSCNLGVGFFADDPARLRAAAKYLEKHR